MAIQNVTNEYVIPRGRAYFDPYDANDELTGEVPFGNTPGVSVSISETRAPHYSSEAGLSEKDKDEPVRVDRTGKLNCDNFSTANAALWLSADVETITQTATAVSGEMRNVIPGREYQLGATPAKPLGVRGVTSITVKNEDGTTTYVAGVDYNVDNETGRVQIIAGGAIVAGKVQFGYTPVAGTYQASKTGGSAKRTGALRIVSANATGKNRDYYMPKVTLSADGDLTLIAEGSSTDYISMAFALEVLKPANGQAIYCDGRPVA